MIYHCFSNLNNNIALSNSFLEHKLNTRLSINTYIKNIIKILKSDNITTVKKNILDFINYSNILTN